MNKKNDYLIRYYNLVKNSNAKKEIMEMIKSTNFSNDERVAKTTKVKVKTKEKLR